MSKKYVPERTKTAGEMVKDYIFYAIVIGVVYFLITSVLKVLVAPFRILFLSDRQRFEARLEKARAKVCARELAREDYETSEDNPMVQYIARFKVCPEKYRNDPDNETYLQWYEDLKNGVLLDSELLWAPEIYVKDSSGENQYNQEFLDYLSRQLDLHEGSRDFGARVLFLKTIRRFYPEFTPKFSVMASEIADLNGRICTRNINSEVVQAIQKKGVSQKMAKNLVGKSANEIVGAVDIIRKCQALGYGEAMGAFCVKYGFNPEHELAAGVDSILKATQNEELAKTLANGVLKPVEVTALVERALGEPRETVEDLYNNISREMHRTIRSKAAGELIGRG